MLLSCTKRLRLRVLWVEGFVGLGVLWVEGFVGSKVFVELGFL